MRVPVRSLGLIVSLASLAWTQPQSSSEAILKHAIQLHQAGDVDGAIREYRTYLKQVPDNVMARSNLGAALSRSGRFEEAIAEYSQALKKDPGNLPIRVNLALSYYKTAQVSTAAEAVGDRRREATPPTQQAVLLLADCDLQLGEYKKVIELLSPLEKQSPNDKALVYPARHGFHPGQSSPARGQVLVGPHPERRAIPAGSGACCWAPPK